MYKPHRWIFCEINGLASVCNLKIEVPQWWANQNYAQKHSRDSLSRDRQDTGWVSIWDFNSFQNSKMGQTTGGWRKNVSEYWEIWSYLTPLNSLAMLNTGKINTRWHTMGYTGLGLSLDIRTIQRVPLCVSSVAEESGVVSTRDKTSELFIRAWHKSLGLFGGPSGVLFG